MRWVALMPLRAGSKGIANKNLRPLAGRPLFAWALAAALDSGIFEEVHVATDGVAIAEAVRALFPQVLLFPRSTASATDTAPTEQVMAEFQAQTRFDVLGLVQATSPFTEAAHFQEARAAFEAGACDSLVTVSRMKRFFWSEAGEALNYDPAERPRRQEQLGELVENGAFYFTRADILRRTGSRLGGRICTHEMPEHAQLEIDEPADWAAAEALLLERRQRRSADTIRALVLDVDGTMTDAGMYYGAEGEMMKRFDTRDAAGLRMLRGQNLRLAVITGEESPAVASRMRKIGVSEYFPGITDKLPVLRSLAHRWRLNLAEIAYMGDDLGDLACLRAVGLALCPADAVGEVRRASDFITEARGGQGAVREACEMILRERA